MLHTIIDPISDLATVAVQQVVGYIAERTSLKKDGLAYFILKILVSALVFIMVVISVPVACVVILFNYVLPLFFA